MKWLLAIFVFTLQAETITHPRPLLVVAERLQASWKRPVTYEEPRWRHASDISMEGDPLKLYYGPPCAS